MFRDQYTTFFGLGVQITTRSFHYSFFSLIPSKTLEMLRS